MTKLSMWVVNRGVATLMIRHSRGQWIMLGNFRVILGFLMQDNQNKIEITEK